MSSVYDDGTGSVVDDWGDGCSGAMEDKGLPPVRSAIPFPYKTAHVTITSFCLGMSRLPCPCPGFCRNRRSQG